MILSDAIEKDLLIRPPQLNSLILTPTVQVMHEETPDIKEVLAAKETDENLRIIKLPFRSASPPNLMPPSDRKISTPLRLSTGSSCLSHDSDKIMMEAKKFNEKKNRMTYKTRPLSKWIPKQDSSPKPLKVKNTSIASHLERFRKIKAKKEHGIDHFDLEEHNAKTAAETFLKDQERLKKKRDWIKGKGREYTTPSQSRCYSAIKDEFFAKRDTKRSATPSKRNFYAYLRGEYGEVLRGQNTTNNILSKRSYIGSHSNFGRFEGYSKKLEKLRADQSIERKRVNSLGNDYMELSKSISLQKSRVLKNQPDELEDTSKIKESEYQVKKKLIRTKFNYIYHFRSQQSEEKRKASLESIKSKFSSKAYRTYEEKQKVLKVIGSMDERLRAQELKIKFKANRKQDALTQDLTDSYLKNIHVKLALLSK